MTNTMQIEIENLKCGGCERSILNGVSAMEGVYGVSVDREKSAVLR